MTKPITGAPKKRGRPSKAMAFASATPESIAAGVIPVEMDGAPIDPTWVAMATALLTTTTLYEAYEVAKLDQVVFRALLTNQDFGTYLRVCKSMQIEYLDTTRKQHIIDAYRWFLDQYRFDQPKIALAALDRITKICGHDTTQLATLVPIVQIIAPGDYTEDTDV